VDASDSTYGRIQRIVSRKRGKKRSLLTFAIAVCPPLVTTHIHKGAVVVVVLVAAVGVTKTTIITTTTNTTTKMAIISSKSSKLNKEGFGNGSIIADVWLLCI
jgi:hypothetical protein